MTPAPFPADALLALRALASSAERLAAAAERIAPIDPAVVLAVTRLELAAPEVAEAALDRAVGHLAAYLGDDLEGMSDAGRRYYRGAVEAVVRAVAAGGAS